MNFLRKTVAAFVGATMLATTPTIVGAAAYKPLPVVSAQDDLITEVRRRKVRPRHSRRYKRRRNRGAGIAAIIIGGAIIGGIIAESSRRDRRRRIIRRHSAHVDWCYYRYRSYRSYDNTFQPYRGRRRQCISPYY